ncbi:Copper amine oxidase N-terminal domain-containing protein [Paenibacillaceae bacterium GAS479]|nr:Copper amine oxidase N-terminal domain-containing protein [Paenibacillaceae bacterium GAS479]
MRINQKTGYFVVSCIVFILIATNSLFSNPGTASAEMSKQNSIHLKMGEFFILYTKPSAPFIDQKKRLMIPLRSIQDLMGGKVSYDEQTKTATVLWLGHTFELKIDSYTAYVDRTSIKMDTKPTLIKGAMYLPLRLFLDYTDVSYTWDQKKGLLHLTDDRVLKGKVFEIFAGNDYADVKKDHAFDLLTYKIVQNKNKTSLIITAKNMSGNKIEEGKSDIHPLLSFSNNGGFFTDSYTRPNNSSIQSVDKDEVITVTQNIESFKNVDYMISVGREMN